MKPPDNVPPSELWLKLQETPRPSEIVDFPRKNADGDPLGAMRIRVLTMQEHDEARIRSRIALKARGFDKSDLEDEIIKEVAGDAVAKELLAMACLTDKPADGTEDLYGRVFRSAKDLDILTADEIAVLFNQYITIQHKWGPFEKTIESEEDLTAWITRLEEGGSHFPLGMLTLPQLVLLAHSLARRAYALSRALESQWLTLPDSLKSSLASCSLGIGLFGAQRSDPVEAGSDKDISTFGDASV